MNTLLVVTLVAALLAAVVYLFQQRDVDGSESADHEQDARVSPLLRGINYLLSDEPDLALREMVQVARLRSEAADVYMALGEMFRAKGEIGRAVRIHQNILARPDVPSELHLQAHIALGKDFQTGGLLDRALRHYERALMMKPDHIGALEASLRIREQSKEWEQAEQLLLRIEQIQGDRFHLHRAYLLAEMAALALEQGDKVSTRELVDRSLKLDMACAHAHFVEFQLALLDQDTQRCRQRMRAMWENSPGYLSLILPLVFEQEDFYLNHGKALLLEFWTQSRDEDLALAWLECSAVRGGEKQARELEDEMSFEAGSLRGSLRLAAITGIGEVSLVQQAKIWRKQMKHYGCRVCGVKVVELRWQCPQCHEWGSMSALKEEAI